MKNIKTILLLVVLLFSTLGFSLFLFRAKTDLKSATYRLDSLTTKLDSINSIKVITIENATLQERDSICNEVSLKDQLLYKRDGFAILSSERGLNGLILDIYVNEKSYRLIMNDKTYTITKMPLDKE